MKNISQFNSNLDAPSGEQPRWPSMEQLATEHKDQMHPLMFAAAEALYSERLFPFYDDQRKTLIDNFPDFESDQRVDVGLELALEQKGKSLAVKIITTLGAEKLDELGEGFEDLLFREVVYFCRDRPSLLETGPEILPKGGLIKYKYRGFMANVFVLYTEISVKAYDPAVDQQTMVKAILTRVGLMKQFWRSCLQQYLRDELFDEKLRKHGIRALVDKHGLGFNPDYESLDDDSESAHFLSEFIAQRQKTSLTLEQAGSQG